MYRLFGDTLLANKPAPGATALQGVGIASQTVVLDTGQLLSACAIH
jgi:hypothetical protein